MIYIYLIYIYTIYIFLLYDTCEWAQSKSVNPKYFIVKDSFVFIGCIEGYKMESILKNLRFKLIEHKYQKKKIRKTGLR